MSYRFLCVLLTFRGVGELVHWMIEDHSGIRPELANAAEKEE